MEHSKLKEFYNNCIYYNITINEKFKKIFNYSGVRIGVQEISRYNWNKNELQDVALLLSKIRDNNNETEIFELINKLNTNKILHFTFSKDILRKFDSILNL